MSFPRYPEYRDSGVEWLGEVPGHWEVTRIRNLYRFIKRQDQYCGTVLSVYRDYGVIEKDSRQDNNNKTPEDLSSYQTVNVGDLVINKMKAWQGSLGVSGLSGITSPDYAVFESIHSENDGYIHYLLRSRMMPGVYQCISNGIRLDQWRLEPDKFLQIQVPLPNLEEQNQILAFLDRETVKIDALVAEQERLIELLKEKRQAVISHAVTKGLNSQAPMKDSGIEWLGEVPEHWSCQRIKHCSDKVVDCLHTTPTYDGELEHPCIRTSDVDPGILHLHRARLVSRDIFEERTQRLAPRAGDILYSREGERFGMAALVPDGAELCLGQRMMMFRTKNDYDPSFIMWALNSDSVFQQVLNRVGGATSPHINISDIVNFYITVPPIEEQEEISQCISRMTTRTDAMIAEAERAIDLLKEHRSALISAAVTGKIDVRGLVAVGAETEAA